MAITWGLTIDCADPARLAEFWAFALGYAPPPLPEGYDTWDDWLLVLGVPEQEWGTGASLRDPDGVGPTLSFQQVPEARAGKNRLHIDVKVGGGRDLVAWEERWPRVIEGVERLLPAGARVVETHDLDGRPDHVVMADPEGNEFCVV